MNWKKWIGLIGIAGSLLVLCLWMAGEKSGSSSDWMERAIEREFAPFKQGISLALLDQTWEQCRDHQKFKRYKIIRSVVYGEEGKTKRLLEAVVKAYPVPDVDFIYYQEDRLKKSFFKRKTHRTSAPVFVSAKDRSLRSCVLFADWVYDVQDMASGWNFLISLINRLHTQWGWQDKIERLFWRGTPWDGKHFGMYTFENWTSLPRGCLVSQSIRHPDLIDARFSEYPEACRGDPERCICEMGAITYIPWEEVLHFKYQMILDGVTCSFPATYWKLLSGCLSFKQESHDIQWFDGELIPWRHYVPVRSDLADMKQKLRWAQSHDAEAKKIAEQAREFALTHLMPEQLILYCYKTLCKYASLQRFEPHE